MNNSEAVWVSVFGYEGEYQVSNLGQVRSLNRVITYADGSTRRRQGKILKPYVSPSGYCTVYLAHNGHQSAKFVHVLVANAFLPKPDYKVEVNHKDGNKKNNCIENLEWCTHRENILHSFSSGLHPVFSSDYMRMIGIKGSKVSAKKSSIPIICETDGLAFVSQNAADRYYGYYPGSICNAIKRNKPFKGRKFRKLIDSEIHNITLLS